MSIEIITENILQSIEGKSEEIRELDKYCTIVRLIHKKIMQNIEKEQPIRAWKVFPDIQRCISLTRGWRKFLLNDTDNKKLFVELEEMEVELEILRKILAKNHRLLVMKNYLDPSDN